MNPHHAEPNQRISRRPWWFFASVLAFPLLVFLVGALYFGGDLGKNSDDYALNQRDPATGEPFSSIDTVRRYFYAWRPFHLVLLFAGGTYFSEHPVIWHWLCAALHAAASLGLFALLRQAAASWHAPAVGALLFFSCPLNHEVIFWFSTTSTAAATAAFMLLALHVIRYGSLPPGASKLAHARALGLITAIAAVIPSFYEQVSAGTAAIGLLALGAAGAARAPVRLLRAGLVTAVCGAVAVVFAAALVLTAPTTSRGGAASFTPADLLSERISAVGKALRWSTIGTRGDDLIAGSITQGLRVLDAPFGLLTCGVTAAAALAFLAIAVATTLRPELPRRHESDDRPSPRPSSRVHPLALAGFLAAGGLVSLLPVVLIRNQNLEMRTLYLPIGCAAGLLALGVDPLWRLARAGIAALLRVAAALLASLLTASAVVITLAWTIGLVGMQAGWRDRYRLDQREIAAITALVPDPPPDAIFAILDNDAQATSTGRLFFDTARPGVFQTTWAATAVLRHAYRRSDLDCLPYNPWVGHAQMDYVDADSFRTQFGVSKHRPDHPAGGTLLSWDEVIPVIIDARGRAFLAERVVVERPDFADFEVRPVLPQRSIEASRGRKRPLRGAVGVVRDTAAPTPETLGWRLIPAPRWTGGAAAEWWTITEWGAFHSAAQLHPTVDGDGRSGLLIAVEPSATPVSVLFRATVRGQDLPDRRSKMSVVLVVTEDSENPALPETARALATIDLTPVVDRAQQRWFPVRIELPAADDGRERTLRISVEARSPADSEPGRTVPPPVWITRPWLAPG